MNRVKLLFTAVAVSCICFLTSCGESGDANLSSCGKDEQHYDSQCIIPAPRSIGRRSGKFRARSEKRMLKRVRYVEDTTIVRDGYDLTVKRFSITVRSSSLGGRIYAANTLKDMAVTSRRGGVTVQCCEVEDYPRASWRGLLLDSGRQYQSMETLKAKLDLLCRLKMNVFHWHLTEGLGWRLEIKKYPRLAIEGSCVGSDREQQGYYTQEQVRELVAYAAERNITVVPEIDMPGHAEAALHVYPEMTCFGEPAPIPEAGYTDVIFCAGKDTVLQFIRDILDEVCDLFPSEYIHLGGDEALKGNWDKCPDCARRMKEEGLKDSHELQLWFASNMAEYLATKGKKAMFWDDVISDGDYPLPSNVAVQWWNYRTRADMVVHKALETGHPVLCSPNLFSYLNYPEEPWKGYDKHRTLSFERAYDENASDKILDMDNPLILGMECALWTDYVLTEDMLDKRLFPRIYAMAQLMWGGKVLDVNKFREQAEKASKRELSRMTVSGE